MHALNRVNEDTHYYLTPTLHKKAAVALVKASEEGELDYALGRFIQWGARKLGHPISSKQKSAIDTFAKNSIPAVGRLVSGLTGQPGYSMAADTLASSYDSIEPIYDQISGKVRGLLNETEEEIDYELDYESATQLVDAVNNLLGSMSRQPSINTPNKIYVVLQSKLNLPPRNSSSGTWYRQGGRVVLQGAGQ